MSGLSGRRTRFFALGLVVMLILAGCTGASNSPPKDSSDVVHVSEPVETTPRHTPLADQNISEYSDSLGEGEAGLSAEDKKLVENLVVGFYDDLPKNESERRAKLLEGAEDICTFDRQYDSRLKASMLEDAGGVSDDAVRRAHYAAQITSELGGDVPVKPMGDFRAGTSDVTKYTPLLGSYNQLAAKSCAASEKRNQASIEEFQVAMLMFGVDAMLISTGAFYSPAFAGTRFITNSASKVGLYRLRYLCGNRCWALGMSEIHVALRGSMLTLASNLVRTSAEMGVELSHSDLEAVAQAHGTDVETLLEDSDISLDQATVKNSSDKIKQCSDEVISEGEEATENSDGILGGIGDGLDKDDVLDQSEDVVDESQSLIENCTGDSK